MNRISRKKLSMLIFTVLFAAATPSCADKKSVNKPSGISLTKELPKLDPSKASIQLTNLQPRIGPASELSSLQVPILDIAHNDADMVQILRCVEGVILRTPTGQDVSQLNNQGGFAYDLEQKKWAWQEAWAMNNKCKVVGTNISRTTFEDLAAGDGRFFYVINPCVSESRSITGKEECSYNIAISQVVETKNNLKPEFIARSQELAEMEGLLSTNFSNLFYYARQIRDKTRQCEDLYAHDQTKGAFLRGIVKIVAGVVGAVVGAYIGGAQGAVAGASLLMGIAGAIMDKPPEFLDCPDVDNFIMQAKHTTSLLQPQVARVLEIRVEMAKLETGYASLDVSIANQTGSGEGGTVATPTAPPVNTGTGEVVAP